MQHKLIGIALPLALVALSARAANLAPNQAASHVGQMATVCGTVASAHFAFRSRGQPTFLNLGRAYPNEDFIAVIWGDDRAKFGKPESLDGNRVCVTGPILLYRGKPEIILEDAEQLHKQS